MKKVMLIIYFGLFFVILATCSQEENEKNQELPAPTTNEVDLIKAKQIIDTGCVVCHSATASEENRMAPPLEAVKRRYLMEYPKIEDFTAAMVDFVIEPTDEKVLMIGAVDRFNIMMPMAYSEDDLKAVATYMYQFELERPDWFEEHYQESQSKNSNRYGKSSD